MTTPSAFAITNNTHADIFINNAFVFADVFNACFDEEELFRLSLTCSAFKKALTPKYKIPFDHFPLVRGFPIAFAIKRDFSAFYEILHVLRAIPSEKTLKFAILTFAKYCKTLHGYDVVRSTFVNSRTFWNKKDSSFHLSEFVELKLIKPAKVYFCPHEDKLGNYILREKIVDGYGRRKYYMERYLTEEEIKVDLKITNEQLRQENVVDTRMSVLPELEGEEKRETQLLAYLESDEEEKEEENRREEKIAEKLLREKIAERLAREKIAEKLEKKRVEEKK